MISVLGETPHFIYLLLFDRVPQDLVTSNNNSLLVLMSLWTHQAVLLLHLELAEMQG